MEFPVISAATAGLLLAIQQLLMFNVGMYRGRVRIATGYGDDLNLERVSRRHGNLAENAAIFVVVLTLLELKTGASFVIISFAGTFILARLAHAVGFSSLAGSHLKEGNKLFLYSRTAGATITALLGPLLGGYLIYAALAS